MIVSNDGLAGWAGGSPYGTPAEAEFSPESILLYGAVDVIDSDPVSCDIVASPPGGPNLGLSASLSSPSKVLGDGGLNVAGTAGASLPVRLLTDVDLFLGELLESSGATELLRPRSTARAEKEALRTNSAPFERAVPYDEESFEGSTDPAPVVFVAVGVFEPPQMLVLKMLPLLGAVDDVDCCIVGGTAALGLAEGSFRGEVVPEWAWRCSPCYFGDLVLAFVDYHAVAR